MFRPTLQNPAQKRTLRPLYAQHQATTWAGFLDPSWDRAFDIYPGTVMARVSKEIFTPYTGAAGQVPVGLAAFFVSPRLGIDEVIHTGMNNYTVWIGGPDAMFEVLAPAFDATADWTLPTDGSTVLLTGNAEGLLTPEGATPANMIVELIDVIGADKIVVKFPSANAAAAAPATP